MGAFGDPHSVVAVVVGQMASGPGERQLCAVPSSHANPILVSALSMGNPRVLSRIPGGLCGVEFIELPLFRDAGPPVVARAVPYALGEEDSRSTFHATARPDLQPPGRKAIRRSVTRWSRRVDLWVAGTCPECLGMNTKEGSSQVRLD
jgi:hypothetical protein